MAPRPIDNPMRVLHLEDSILDHQLVCRALDAAEFQYTIKRVETLEAFRRITTDAPFDLILADYRLPGFTALDAWSTLAGRTARPPFILLSGTIGEAAAVSAIHEGISDYLHKDDLGRLKRVIIRTLDVYQTKAAKARADQALALSEKRLSEFADHLQSTIEKERAAIAREIHDDIGGSLAAAKLDLAWMARHSMDPATLTHVQAATEMLQLAIGASQRIMMDLRPAILDQGLFAAIQWLVTGFERRTGIKTILNTSNEQLSTPKSIQLTAYRTAQEALTNASKYAECNWVRVELSDGEGVLTVEITDNGKGISKQEMEKPKAFGLRGLHERAKTVGGWLDISTREGLGTSITLSVPLPAAGLADQKELPQ